jgi:DNA-binding CsgD family transcriptional regulator
VPTSTRAWAQLALSGILYAQSEFEAALVLGEESLQRFRATANMPGIARASDHAACVAVELDENRSAELIEEALAACAACAGAPWAKRTAAHVLHYRGLFRIWRDDVAGAEAIFREVVAQQERIAREEGVEHPYTCWPLASLGDIARIKGSAHDALRFYQASLAHAMRFQEARCIVGALTGVAATLASTHRPEEAARLFGAAEAFSERGGLTWFKETFGKQLETGLPEPWQSSDAAATSAWLAGRRVAITDAVVEAVAINLDAPTAIPSLARGRSQSPDAAVGFDLTRRELEVLTLLSQRMTDPEISERLFISTKTASNHVSNILTKLGAPNRRQAAAIAAHHALV